MIFKVYDRKNKDRLLGTVKADPRSRHMGMFRMALMERIDWLDAEYNPDAAPTARTVDFYLERRSESHRDESNRGFVACTTTKEWTVFETDAPLEDLMLLTCFWPAGCGALEDRILRRCWGG